VKCLVAVKKVIDPYVAIRVAADATGVVTKNVKTAMNPFDEIAMEAAVQLKEQNIISEIIAVSIGDNTIQETLRQALARGADKALLIETNQPLIPLSIAKILQWVVNHEAIDIVILGKQAIDDDCNQTGQMLAAKLGWAQGTFVSDIAIDLAKQQITVVREVDDGLETLVLKLPVVITSDLRLNEPRYISLPNVMQAKRKPLTITPLAELNLPLLEELHTIKVTAPAAPQAGIMLETVAELIDKLKNEARVIE